MRPESPNNERIASALRDGFGGGHVLVIGDMMLDRYLWGSVERVSPEAPTPVLCERRQSERAGGAGNVALNLAGLGLQVSIAGIVGNDNAGDRLRALLNERGIDTSAVNSLPDRPTTTKTRVIAGHQHVLRLDDENLSPIESPMMETVLAAAMDRAPVDAVVLSDYSKGIVSHELCRRVVGSARASGIPLLVKPKGRDFSKYAGATGLSSNLAELALASGMPTTGADNLVAASRSVVEGLGLDYLVVTRGADGVTLVARNRICHSPARPREVFDVSGASDTVIASIAASVLGGLGETDMLHLVNVAAGFVVGRIGTVAVDQASLLHLLHHEEGSASEILYQIDDVVPLAESWRAGGHRIVFASGAFDGLRANDVRLLCDAASQGDKLIVGVIGDGTADGGVESSATMEDLLGRASVVALLKPVDTVVLCEARSRSELIQVLHPDVVIEGRD